MEWVWPAILIVVLLIAWFTNVFGAPGNWIIVAAVVMYWAWMPPGTREAISLTVVIAIAILALAGELLEFVAGSMGVSKKGGSRRSAIFAILGSIVGGIAGLMIGMPIPVVGPIVGPLLFGSLGAMAGAIYGERSVGREWSDAIEVGRGAFWGRAFGTLAKLAIGGAMVVIGIAAVLVR